MQGIYLLATGIWPVIHLQSFMFITGPKTDTWLVKTVGLITVAASISIISLSKNGRSLITGISIACAFAIVDFSYAFSGVISKVYLIDGFIEMLFISLLLFFKIFDDKTIERP
jgi:hypothetical protein